MCYSYICILLNELINIYIQAIYNSLSLMNPLEYQSEIYICMTNISSFYDHEGVPQKYQTVIKELRIYVCIKLNRTKETGF